MRRLSLFALAAMLGLVLSSSAFADHGRSYGHSGHGHGGYNRGPVGHGHGGHGHGGYGNYGNYGNYGGYSGYGRPTSGFSLYLGGSRGAIGISTGSYYPSYGGYGVGGYGGYGVPSYGGYCR